MPNQNMTNINHVVFFAKFDKAVSRFKTISTWFRMNFFSLQNVFRFNSVVLGLDQFDLFWRITVNLCLIQGGANEESILTGLF